MEGNLFENIFGKIHISANVKSNLRNSIVKSVKVWLEKKTIEINLSSDRFIDEECLEDFRQDILESFPGIEKVNANIFYPLENLSIEEKIGKYWDG